MLIRGGAVSMFLFCYFNKIYIIVNLERSEFLKFCKDEDEESKEEIRSKAKFAKRDSLLFSRTYTITYMVWVWEDIQKKDEEREEDDKEEKSARINGTRSTFKLSRQYVQPFNELVCEKWCEKWCENVS